MKKSDGSCSLLVVEDDRVLCRRYEKLCEQSMYFNLIACCDNAAGAIVIIKNNCPDAIVLELELNGGGGNGIEILQMLSETDLPRKPVVVVATKNISTVTHNVCRRLGVDFIITKTQSDYSESMVLDLLKQLTAGMSASAGAKKAEKDVDVNVLIARELDAVGINAKLKGRTYLCAAIRMIIEKKRPNISAEVAQYYGKSAPSVERAMQNAINSAWRNTDIETLEANYTAYINPKKGVPTVTSFIYYYADKIRAEL